MSLFTGVLGPEQKSFNLDATIKNACSILLSSGCGEPGEIRVNYDVDGSGTVGDAGDTLLALCETEYGIFDELECKRQLCKCGEEEEE